MRIPYESLDDFNISAAPKPAGPPAARRACPSGLVEVVKPLARLEDFAKSEAAAAESTLLPPAVSGGPHRLSKFHQSLAICGAFALIVLFLVAGLYIGISDRPVVPAIGSSDVAMDRRPDDAMKPAEEPSASSPAAAENSPDTDEFSVVRPAARRVHARPRLSLAVYRPRRRPLLPQYVVSEFSPTTLIIYAENGEIKTRIEPWLTAGYKKPLAFPN